MKKIGALCILTTSFLMSCTSAENADSASEISCASASGLWLVSSVTCDDVEQSEIGYVALDFTSSITATQAQGAEACRSQIPWQVTHGDFDNSIAFSGSGTLSCASGGSSVNSCSHSSNSCDSTTDVTGVVNSFPTCAISGSTIIMSRTLSDQNNPAGLSPCANGEAEEITFIQSLDPGTGDDSEDGGGGGSFNPASLSITQANPTNFGSVTVGTNSQVTFTLVNSGDQGATGITAGGLAGAYSYLGGSFPGTGGDCGATLSAGASCTFVVNFSPPSTVAHGSQITLNYNDGQAAQSLFHSVQGTGVGPVALLLISNAPLFDFGNHSIGTSHVQVFTLTNTGAATANAIAGTGLNSQFGFEGGVFPGSGNCGLSLVAGASCIFTVQFTPVIVGPENDTIEINYNDGSGATTTTRDITGTAL